MQTPAAFLAAAACVLVAIPCEAQSQPRYFTQMQAELQAMGLSPQCHAANPQTGTCTVQAAVAPTSTRRFLVALQYDDTTDTIYVYADHYATLRGDAAAAPAAFRRMLEINWETLASHFEWSAATGEVRLSTVIQTDSNFDRRAFRGVVRSLIRVADHYADEVARLTGAPVGEAAPPPTAAPTPAAAH